MFKRFIDWFFNILSSLINDLVATINDMTQKLPPKVEHDPKTSTPVKQNQEAGTIQMNMSDIPWYKIAMAEVGVKEILGSKNTPRILEYHQATSLKATNDETAWCSAFVSWCLEKAGYKSTHSAWAKSYLKYGTELKFPKLGCICVFTRGPQSGHVAFYISTNKDGSLKVLGGNQSNSVCVQDHSKSTLLSYRWPIK